MWSSTFPRPLPEALEARIGAPSRSSAGSLRGDVWRSVDVLLDRARTLADLRVHRLHLLAARRWHELGRTIPVELAREREAAAFSTLVAPVVLQKVREACEGPILLMKGLEVATRYPDPSLRPFRDLDLLVPDALGTQRALIEAGFRTVGGPDSLYLDRHHLSPLAWPGVPLLIEVHRRPEWPSWAEPPSADELLSETVAASVGVDGILAPPAPHHALLLAAHAWSAVPLRRLLDLVDVAALWDELERDEIGRLSRRWGLGGVWATTCAATGALLLDDSKRPWSLRLWARDLEAVRDRTVFENHVRRFAGSFWALPPDAALRETVRVAAAELSPGDGESWREKLLRSIRALRAAFSRLSEHNRSLGPDSRRANDAWEGRPH